MKRVLALFLLLGVAGGVYWLGQYRRSNDDKPLLNVAQEVALTVTTAAPARSDIVRLVQAPGEVEAVLEVDISSEIVSKIEYMPVEEGDVVQKGDLLCRLDDDNLLADVESGEARVAQLRAGITQAEADLEKSERDCARQARLSESAATSDLEIQDYLTTHKKARATVEMREQELAQAEAYLKRVREDLKRTVIESPITGIISKLNAKEGEVVITGTMNNPGTVIMSVSDLSKMQVKAKVDEVDVPLVKADQPARIYLQADQDRPVPARVVRVASKGSREPGRDVVNFETILEVLSNDPRIKPGMSANLEIEVARSDQTITIPVEAVVHRMRKDLPPEVVAEFDKKQVTLDLSERARQAQYLKVVYIMEKEAAKVRLITPGIADTRRVELVEGVKLEDVVITGPYRSLDQLKDGKKVALDEAEKKKQEEAKLAAKGTAGEAKPAETQSDESEKKEGSESQAEGNEKADAVAAGGAGL